MDCLFLFDGDRSQAYGEGEPWHHQGKRGFQNKMGLCEQSLIYFTTDLGVPCSLKCHQSTQLCLGVFSFSCLHLHSIRSTGSAIWSWSQMPPKRPYQMVPEDYMTAIKNDQPNSMPLNVRLSVEGGNRPSPVVYHSVVTYNLTCVWMVLQHL